MQLFNSTNVSFVPNLGKPSWSIQANRGRTTFEVKVTKRMGIIASYIVW